jgi:peptidoglycan/LPS O-acetylase OafA/YrhL
LPAQSPPSFSDTWASVSLDLVRGLAAILVLVDHWRNLFFLNYHEVRVHRLFFAVPYTLTAAAHEAVVIFFVLSGFLIGGTVRRAIERGEWSWTSYLTHRLVRLWIVLLPGLVLCFLLDRIGVAFAASRSLFPGDAAENDTAIAFVGNLFFLQGVLVPAFGSDGPLWSLANEFWYYILFPLGLLAVFPSTRPRTRLFSAALFLGLCLGLRTTLLPLFPLWLLGAALFALSRSPLGNSLRWFAVATYVPILFLCTYLHRILGIGSDYVLAVATAILMWTLLCASQTAPAAALKVRFSRGLARFSYTLYVVHFPLLMLIAALVVGDRRWQPTSVHIAAGLGILAVTVAYAYGIAALTEFRTDRVRVWVERRLGVASAPCAPDARASRR